MSKKLAVVLVAVLVSGSFGNQASATPLAVDGKVGTESAAVYSACTEPIASYLDHSYPNDAKMLVKRSRAIYYSKR